MRGVQMQQWKNESIFRNIVVFPLAEAINPHESKFENYFRVISKYKNEGKNEKITT